MSASSLPTVDLDSLLQDLSQLNLSDASDLQIAANRLRPVVETQSTSAALARVHVPAPEPYKGERNASKALAWIRKVELYFRVARVRTQDYTPIAALLLSDKAGTWWAHHRLLTVESPWETFKTSFLDAFSPKDAQDEARRLLNSLQMTTTLENYVSDFLELESQLGHQDSGESLSCFLRGLPTLIRVFTQMAKPATISDAILQAELMDRTIRNSQNPNELNSLTSTRQTDLPHPVPTSSIRANFATTPHQSESSAMDIDAIRLPSKLTQQERDHLRRTNGCLRCRQHGRHAAWCNSTYRFGKQGGPRRLNAIQTDDNTAANASTHTGNEQ
jgi:hypothetical protein